MNKATLETLIRNDYLAFLTDAISEHFDTDVLDVSASELAIPVVDAEGNEKFVLIKVSIPRGNRVNGGYEPYDGYAAHEEWELVKADRADKALARQEKAARAIKEQERKRAARKVVKDLHEKGFNGMVHDMGTGEEENNSL